jgi:hypothetical protein
MACKESGVRIPLPPPNFHDANALTRLPRRDAIMNGTRRPCARPLLPWQYVSTHRSDTGLDKNHALLKTQERAAHARACQPVGDSLATDQL